ncbi:GH1 family beta-glucosidase [Marinoscillum sp. MHG1-6]|uniref:GH1 family beta-glucosidase n=1 Tax=Marinoscillum sp. MHG1-6 TaxID=2959627 RepID=UPI00215862F3|nr:GH1 family beta-glucosidase [Marinoscillum sp. MHG1-6]
MKRRDFNKKLILGTSALTFSGFDMATLFNDNELRASDFGESFDWGCAAAAFQTEGAWKIDGKGLSIWDDFTHQKGKVHSGQNAEIACDFYHRYTTDLDLLKGMNFGNFRFSLAWSRLLPDGVGKVNQKGLDYYHRLMDACLERGVTPWVTLYHWDLPLALHEKGGWTNRDMLGWFSEFTDLATRSFGDRVRNWMVLNEPAAFVGHGYGSGYHAPGEKSVKKFIQATHHAVLCQAVGGRVIRANISDPHIGTTFSCSEVTPLQEGRDNKAAKTYDALYNRLFIEPSLGLGYPIEDLAAIKPITKYMKAGDEERMKFDFDFIGIQNYFRIVVKRSLFPPVLWAKEVMPEKRGVETNSMGFEIFPKGIYTMLKKFSSYEGVKKIVVTENGLSLDENMVDGQVNDDRRVQFFKDYLTNTLKAKNEGVPVEGYFVWSLTDNFEWSEGYDPRFGLVFINYKNQERTVKKSGHWWKDFLTK